MVFFFCLASAVLLILSYPKVEWWPLAWVAMVPLFIVLDGQRPWTAFRRAYQCGLIFFGATFWWFIYVTWPGAILLSAFLALYFAAFGPIFIYFQRLPLLPRIFVLSAAWVGLEFVRSHLFTGFGWATLGHSQYQNIWLIQIANLTGVYGVSFLIMLVNLVGFETWKAWRGRSQVPRRSLWVAQMAVALMLLAVLAYGRETSYANPGQPTVSIGVVQPNIPQTIKWDEALQPVIVAKTISLTKSLKPSPMGLIVWPETSLPGIANQVPDLVGEIRKAAQDLQAPILFGSIDQKDDHYYNSAFLMAGSGLAGRYDKIHLVPFGEFLPLRPLLGWINRFVPLDDFSSGTTYEIFTLKNGARFGVLICFEDTLEGLCRHFVLGGAQFLVNMTNDAWFWDTKAPFLHLQAAVFSAVANHRAVVTSSNTGPSVLVDPWGRILKTVHNAKGKQTYVAGALRVQVPVTDRMTFYTKYGDVFTYLCFACILGGMALLLRR